MRKALSVLLLALVFVLCACGAANEPQAAETPAPVEEEQFVQIGPLALSTKSAALELAGTEEEIAALIDNAALLPALTEIRLNGALPPFARYEELCRAFPGARIDVETVLFGERVDRESVLLDLSGMRPEQTDELLALLPYLDRLEELNFVSADGVCAFSPEDIPQLDRIREAAPELKLDLCFELFGQTVSSEDERIEYFRVPIGNEGVELVRAVLPYLRSCRYLLMDGCGVDNEVMAQLRDDFPDTKVVWRIWLCKPYYESNLITRWYSFLTDAERIRTVKINNGNSHLLKYCTEAKYVDFGHNMITSEFSFLGYMPKLEVCIIAITGVKDISCLANCPDLEYLEIYGSQVADLSPLANCTKLKHLNCSRLYGLTDITPIYGLELERLRCVATHVPKEQLEEYSRLHPDCEILDRPSQPHEGNWRYDDHGQMVPRYALLREQLKYDEDRANGIP